MRAVIQRVTSASIEIDGRMHSRIGFGVVILLGIKIGDTEEDSRTVAEKCAALRIFQDDNEKMNLSLKDNRGAVLVVSQFTLYGDTRKGNRPSFVEAAPPEIAEPLYNRFVDHMKNILGNDRIATGVFKAMMEVSLVNSGPVTVIVESKERAVR